MAIPIQTGTPGTPAEPGSCLSAVAPDLHRHVARRVRIKPTRMHTFCLLRRKHHCLTKSTGPRILYMHSTEQGKRNEAQQSSTLVRRSKLASDMNFASTGWLIFLCSPTTVNELLIRCLHAALKCCCTLMQMSKWYFQG